MENVAGKIRLPESFEEELRKMYVKGIYSHLTAKHKSGVIGVGGKSRCLSAKSPNASRKGRRRR